MRASSRAVESLGFPRTRLRARRRMVGRVGMGGSYGKLPYGSRAVGPMELGGLEVGQGGEYSR